MPAEQILERLMREYGDSVFRMCYLYLKDYYLAEDATQETIADDHSIEEVVKKTVVATLAILMLGGTTVAASYSFTNKISVNDEVLTELDEIK